ncbi:MAG: amidohydrolase family protein [Gorillibacterium sp.]|nr:amidohydrolase family protein [Gorillibacterium sp.]
MKNMDRIRNDKNAPTCEGDHRKQRIDSHQHYWLLKRADYGWLNPNAGILYQDYSCEQLQPHLVKTGIDRTIVVQAANTLAETEYLLSLCEQYDTIAGVVGWLDLASEQFEEQFNRLRRNPYFVGIRPILQDNEDPGYLLRPQVMRSIQRLVEAEFPMDMLINTKQMPHIIKLLAEFPELRGALNHLGNPDLSAGEHSMSQWKAWIHEISAYPGIYCKLSGMGTLVDKKHGKWEDIIPYVHDVINVFGPSRVMFGSDWPVCLLAAEYESAYDQFLQTLPRELTVKDKEGILGLNAARFYRLGNTLR